MALTRVSTALGFFVADPLVSTQDSEPIISLSGGGTGDILAVTATAPLSSSGGTSPNISIALATTAATGVSKPDGVTITVDANGVLSTAPGAQSPLQGDINASGHNITGVNIVGAQTITAQAITVNGQPVLTSLTPWTTDIAGGGHNLSGVGTIAAGAVTVGGSPVIVNPWTGDVNAAGHNLNNLGNLATATIATTGAVTVGTSLTVAGNTTVNNLNSTGNITVNGTPIVTSVFGRGGAVVAQAGDYTAAMVTNAVASNVVYSDPAWIGSLSWAKITGAPAAGGGQTPWLQPVDANHFALIRVPNVTGDGNLTIDSGGAGTFSINTNSQQRVLIDSAGQVRINAADSTSGAAVTLSGIASITANSFNFNGLGGFNILTGSTLKNRISVNADGTAALNARDSDGGSVMTFGPATIASFPNAEFDISSSGQTFNLIANGNSSMNIWANGKVRVSTNPDGSTFILARDSDGAQILYLGNNGNAFVVHDASKNVGIISDGPIYFSSGPSWPPKAYLGTSGYFGIGTTAPDDTFVAYGGTGAIKVTTADPQDATVKLNRTGTNARDIWLISEAPGFKIYDHTVGSYRMAIDVNGNVGIGTTTPAALLDVNGDVRAAGSLEIDGTYLSMNLYYNGSQYLYRNSAPAYLMLPNGNPGVPTVYLCATGTAGTAATLIPTFEFHPGSYMRIDTPVVFNLVPSPAAAESAMSNSNMVIEKPSDTQLVFKVKGNDGVLRSGTLTLS